MGLKIKISQKIIWHYAKCIHYWINIRNINRLEILIYTLLILKA